MRALGLINDRVQEDHAAYGIAPNPRHVNLPYPGVFLLGRDGVVAQKRFFESYRERDTGASLIAQALGIAPGLRVYGEPAPAGVTPLWAEIDAIEGLEVGAARWPLPQRLPRTGVADNWVHTGVVRGMMPLTFSAPPGGGDRVLAVTVHYQEYDEARAVAPSSVRVTVPVREAPLVGRSLPTPT